MKWLTRARDMPPVPTLLPRERVLAWTRAADGGLLAATRDALHLVFGGGDEGSPARRLEWQQVEAADWDAESSTFRVSEVGHWGQPRVEHRVVLDGARALLEVVHERVTASILIQRRFSVPGGGLMVIARRAPGGHGPPSWIFEYDESVDPDDPGVRAVAERALRATKDEVGLD